MYALAGERVGLVRSAFFNWKPMKGREEWRDEVIIKQKIIVL